MYTNIHKYVDFMYQFLYYLVINNKPFSIMQIRFHYFDFKFQRVSFVRLSLGIKMPPSVRFLIGIFLLYHIV